MTADHLAELLDGNLYINIHTAENGGGEIRGQVEVAAGVRMIARLTGTRKSRQSQPMGREPQSLLSTAPTCPID
jgi:hypothetical protein